MNVRISKYNPALRDVDGFYKENDWTSVCDVGVYNNLTYQEYENTEEKYWKVISSILKYIGVECLTLNTIEEYVYNLNKDDKRKIDRFAASVNWREDMVVHIDNFREYFSAAMQELVWFKAVSVDGTYLHFGYDLYVYCGSNKDFEWSEVDGVYVEYFRSPYVDT